MDTIKIEGKKTKLIAHRGVCGLERENTCPSFVAAGNRTYYGIETDIQVMGDGTLIALHDDTLQRVTNWKIDTNVKQNGFGAIKDVVLPDLEARTEAPFS